MPSTPPPPAGGPPAPRRDDCPWCGSVRLRTRLRPHPRATPRTASAVDECRDCAHAFRNPPPVPEGPALPRPLPGTLPGPPPDRRRHRRHRLAAARALLPFPEPESWLDVGTGHARFPEAARDVFPYTAFDGLDPTPRVIAAREAGRIEEAHVGRLTDPRIEERLRGRYDVVSLFHHLGRTPDPREELRAALAVLRPGGHLVVEVPDPACAFGALLGPWWFPHSRIRQLHLLPLDNLCAELEARGCEIVSTDRRGAHVPYDLSAALALLLARALPAPLRPAGTPLVLAAAAVDHTLAPLLRRTRFSNAYRVVARKAPAGDGPPTGPWTGGP
ncbi:class I SAM-dependent methyltransferase [Streptomyces sp. NPDC047000]|uniref:class I SAM-dependent methyltransferase n=1 Tax=Streptomyces sp. NPDC047000 TaxID=3155474 RepID=UPI0033D5DD9E